MNSKSMALKHCTLFLAAATIFLAGTAFARLGGKSSLCSHAQYPVVCDHIVEGKATASSATTAAMELLRRKSTVGKTMTLTAAAHPDKFTKQLLDTCNELYDDSISNLESGLKSLQSGDKAGLNNFLSAIISNIVACDDGFLGEEDSPLGSGSGKPNPLSKYNSIMRKVTSTALELSGQIH